MSKNLNPLSAKSPDSNVILWNTKPGIYFRVEGALYVSNENPLSIKTFYRWVSMLYDCDLEYFDLWEITPFESSHAQRKGDKPLSRDSTNSLSAGDYAAFPYAKHTLSQVQKVASFAEQKKYECDPSADPMEKPTGIMADQCSIKGAVPHLDAIFICPPCLVYELIPEIPVADKGKADKGEDAIDDIKKDFRSNENIITICRDLLPQFEQNLCGIDVDGDCRLIEFNGPKFTSSRTNSDTLLPMARFLRLHFRRCLLVNMGKCEDEYSKEIILDDMGCLLTEGMDPEALEARLARANLDKTK